MKLGLTALAVGVMLCAGVLAFAGGAQEGTAGKPAVLNVISNNHNNTLIFINNVLPKYEAKAGIKVNADVAGDTKMKGILDVRSGKAFYDIIAFDSSNLPEYVRGNILLALDDYIIRDNAEVNWEDMSNAAKGLSTQDGKVYGVPSIIQIWMVYYNTDLLAQAGISAPAETWNQLADYAAKLTNPDKKQYGFVYQPAKTYNSVVHSFWATMVGFGGYRSTFKDMPKDYTPVIDGPIPLESLSYLGTMMKYGPPGANTYAWGDAIASFGKGESAIYPLYSDASNIFQDPKQSNVVDKFFLAPQPSYPGRPTSRYLPYGGWSWGISSIDKHKDASWELLKWMISPSVLADWTKVGGVPFRLSQYGDPAIQQQFAWAKLVYERDVNNQIDTDYRPRIAAWAEIENIFGNQLSSYFTGAKSAQAALSDGSAQLKAYMVAHDYPVLSE